MASKKSNLTLDLQNVPLTDEAYEASKKSRKKKSIYSIVIMKIFFIKSKKRNSKESPKSPKSPKLPKLPKSPKSPKSSKSSKSPKLAPENKKKNGASLEFVYTVTDFDQEQIIKAKGYIKSSKYSEALAILLTLSFLEQITKQQPVKSDYDILFLIGNCYEYLNNYQMANKYYKICADYIFDDGYWETTYGKFLLKHSNLLNNNNNNYKKIENGLDRLLSAANKKKFVSAMYVLGKIYIDGLYDVKQDFQNGEIYLKRAYNGGERDRAWAIYEKKAKELVANGQLNQVPLERVWARS